MVRYRRVATAAITGVAGAITAGSCASRSGADRAVDRALDTYEQCLRLDAEAVNAPLLIGQRLHVAFRLKNVCTAVTVKACIGPNRQYALLAAPPAVRDGHPAHPSVESVVVDHPWCERPFALGPGKWVEWSRDVVVDDIGVGKAELLARVQVVYPHQCAQNGCDATDIKAILPFDVRQP